VDGFGAAGLNGNFRLILHVVRVDSIIQRGPLRRRMGKHTKQRAFMDRSRGAHPMGGRHRIAMTVKSQYRTCHIPRGGRLSMWWLVVEARLPISLGRACSLPISLVGQGRRLHRASFVGLGVLLIAYLHPQPLANPCLVMLRSHSKPPASRQPRQSDLRGCG